MRPCGIPCRWCCNLWLNLSHNLDILMIVTKRCRWILGKYRMGIFHMGRCWTQSLTKMLFVFVCMGTLIFGNSTMGGHLFLLQTIIKKRQQPKCWVFRFWPIMPKEFSNKCLRGTIVIVIENLRRPFHK